jgi:hypothetical protein
MAQLAFCDLLQTHVHPSLKHKTAASGLNQQACRAPLGCSAGSFSVAVALLSGACWGQLITLGGVVWVLSAVFSFCHTAALLLLLLKAGVVGAMCGLSYNGFPRRIPRWIISRVGVAFGCCVGSASLSGALGAVVSPAQAFTFSATRC